MDKKRYMKPAVICVEISDTLMQTASILEGDADPMKPMLSKRNDEWEDDFEDEDFE